MDSTSSSQPNTTRAIGGGKPQTQTRAPPNLNTKDNRNKHAAPVTNTTGNPAPDRREAAALAAEKRMQAVSLTLTLTLRLTHPSAATHVES